MATEISNEEWRAVPVDGYRNGYEISNLGRLRRSETGTILIGGLDKDGYRIHVLSYEGKRKTVKRHRLVASAFLSSIPGKWEVNHKDGDKLNNHVENLEWVDSVDNNRHALKYGLRVRKGGQSSNVSKLSDRQAKEIRLLYSTGQYTQAELGKEYGVTGSCIGLITRRQIFKDAS